MTKRFFQWIAGLTVAFLIAPLASGVLILFSSGFLPKEDIGFGPYLVTAAYPTWNSATYPPEAIHLDYVHQVGHSFVLPGEGWLFGT